VRPVRHSCATQSAQWKAARGYREGKQELQGQGQQEAEGHQEEQLKIDSFRLEF